MSEARRANRAPRIPERFLAILDDGASKNVAPPYGPTCAASHESSKVAKSLNNDETMLHNVRLASLRCSMKTTGRGQMARPVSGLALLELLAALVVGSSRRAAGRSRQR
jgi:hypothetical protein